MNYIEYSSTTKLENTVATTGFFDGVHIGHRAVLGKLTDEAKKRNKTSSVITFWPHPRIVLQKKADELLLLNTLEEKRELVSSLGIDNFIVIPFTTDLAALSAEEFMSCYLSKQLGVSHLVVGYDHHFGKGGKANFNDIRQFASHNNISAEQVGVNEIDGISVSSSKIREVLLDGKTNLANKWLGYNYMLSGEVIHGQKLGRKLGYPTANIQPDSRLKLIPMDGIYAVEVIIDKHEKLYQGMLSIGIRPTIDSSKKRTIEVNIFDFDQQIYGQTITVRFIQRLRDEWKLESLDALIHQLAQDKLDTISVFNNR